MKKIVVLASHNGSTFVALQNAILEGKIDAEIIIVISNNFDSEVLKKAQECGIKNCVINSKTTQNSNEDIFQILIDSKCEYVLLSGYMKKVSEKITTNFKVINSHPALLPKFGGAGMYGRFVHEAVFNSGEEETGCTVHFVNEHYDEGEIILQKRVSIDTSDTIDDIEKKVKKIESVAIVEAFKMI